MNNQNIKQVFKTKEVQDFLAKANEFCALIESNRKIKPLTFLSKMHKALVGLYLAGLSLPDIDVDDGIDFDNKYRLSDKDYQKITTKLPKKIGVSNQFYFETFDPIFPTKDEPTQGSLVDDLADIYRDIKSDLVEIEEGTNVAIIDALWELKFGVSTHWGNHTVDALRALHFLVFDHGKEK